MPLIYNALETKTPAIQEKVLKVIPTIADSLDISTVKASLFPRIQVRQFAIFYVINVIKKL